MEKVELTIPSRPEYVTTLRLVTASVAQKMGFDFEEIEDLRVCVSEAVNYLLDSNETLKISLEEEEEKLHIRIAANLEEKEEEGLTLHRQIMETLMDEVEESAEGIRLTKIR